MFTHLTRARRLGRLAAFGPASRPKSHVLAQPLAVLKVGSMRASHHPSRLARVFTTSSRPRVDPRQMDAIDTVRNELRPQLEDLLTHLGNTEQIAAAAFFTQILMGLNKVEREEQLLELFIELSTTAFLGLEFDAAALTMIDDLLANAELIAQAFSADSANPQ